MMLPIALLIAAVTGPTMMAANFIISKPSEIAAHPDTDTGDDFAFAA